MTLTQNEKNNLVRENGGQKLTQALNRNLIYDGIDHSDQWEKMEAV